MEMAAHKYIISRNIMELPHLEGFHLGFYLAVNKLMTDTAHNIFILWLNFLVYEIYVKQTKLNRLD